MPDPLQSHRTAVQQLRWRTEQLLAAASTVSSARGSPFDGVHREVLASIGAAVTDEFFGRRRIGSSIGRAIAANSQASQQRQATHSARAEAGAVVQQARQIVDSIAAVIGHRESRILRTMLTRADAAQRADTALRRVLLTIGRIEAWQPSAPASLSAAPSIDALRTLEQGLRRCIEDRLSRLSQNWWNERVPVEVRRHAERRKALRDQLWPWLDGGDHPLVEYLDFPDYAKIILEPQNWVEGFASIFVDPDSLRVKLRELEPIRNDLAHAREIVSANAERLRLYSRELVNQMQS